MKTCAACGKPSPAMIGMGGVLICRECEPDITAEINRLRSAGKPVNVAHIARAMFREQYSGGNYLIRDIPEELYTRIKHRAIDDGLSIRDLMIKALHTYLA